MFLGQVWTETLSAADSQGRGRALFKNIVNNAVTFSLASFKKTASKVLNGNFKFSQQTRLAGKVVLPQFSVTFAYLVLLMSSSHWPLGLTSGKHFYRKILRGFNPDHQRVFPKDTIMAYFRRGETWGRSLPPASRGGRGGRCRCQGVSGVPAGDVSCTIQGPCRRSGGSEAGGTSRSGCYLGGWTTPLQT